MLAVLFWSINAVVSKAVANVIDPAAISFYRWLLVFLVLTPFMIRGIYKNDAMVVQYSWKLFILSARLAWFFTKFWLIMLHTRLVKPLYEY
ncbi:MAG: EamA family transporter [Candidatus Phlomobacter fragariae]